MTNAQLFPSYPLMMLSPEWRGSQNRRVTGIWVSKKAGSDKDNGAAGYLKMLKETSFATDAPLTPGDSALKLQPVTNHMNELTTGSKILLQSINFYAVHVRSLGGGGYTADQINAIIDQSLEDAITGHNWAYNQGGLRFTPLASHQPNWFRPKFVLNQSLNIFSTIDQTDPTANTPETTSNEADLSIGLDCPFFYAANMEFDSITQVDVYAQCLQAIEMDASTIVYQNYPIICNAQFIVQP